MTSQLYLIQDSVSGIFGSPFFARCDDQVIRDFKDLSKSGVPDHCIRDSVIYCFGSFESDAVNPRFDMYSCPRVVVRGSAFMPKEVPDEEAD